MDYYERRRKALLFINKLLEQGTPLPMIVYKVENAFGFGIGLIKKRMKLIEEMKNVSK